MPLRSLATRNLLRSEALMVPSGQDVARVVGANVLKAADLRAIAESAGSTKALPLSDEQLDDCYLWSFYLPRLIMTLKAVGWERPVPVSLRKSSLASLTPMG